CVAGGSTVSDAEYFSAELAAGGIDFISLSRGGKFDDARQPKVGEAAYPYTGLSGYECMPSYYSDAAGPFGRNLDPAARIRAHVRANGHRTPIVVAGGIHNFQQAEAALANGCGDLVGFARQALDDTDWFLKVRSGRGEAVRGTLQWPVAPAHADAGRGGASVNRYRDDPDLIRSLVRGCEVHRDVYI